MRLLGCDVFHLWWNGGGSSGSCIILSCSSTPFFRSTRVDAGSFYFIFYFSFADSTSPLLLALSPHIDSAAFPLCNASPFATCRASHVPLCHLSLFATHRPGLASPSPCALLPCIDPVVSGLATCRPCASDLRHALRLVARHLSCRLATSRHSARTCGGNGRDSVSGQVGRVTRWSASASAGASAGLVVQLIL